MSWAQLANACNPSYSRSRDQEECGSKPAWKNSLGDTVWKIPHKSRAGGMGQVLEHQHSKQETQRANHGTTK
jgi:hypothetical protein